MSLQFILGRGSRDKSTYILDEMKTIISEDSQAEVFYLVPDHIKFESEMQVLENIKKDKGQKYAGMMRLQVFSFTRLAWLFLQGKAALNKTELTNTGLTMLLKKLTREREESLTIFRGESHLDGFIEKLTTLFMEFRNGKISPDDIQVLIEEGTDNTENQDYSFKLHDIYLLFTAFIEEITGEYIEREDIIQALIEEIKERDLSHTSIFIDHYETFSAQEQELILEFIKNAENVRVSLTLDQGYAVQYPELTDLFYQPAVTYFKLYQQARENNLQVEFDKIVTDKISSVSEGVCQLEEYWRESQKLSPIASQPRTPNDSIEIWEATTKQAEALHVANKINQLVAEENYRYNDFLVVTRKIEDYYLLLKPYFDRNEIPYFMDNDETMADHPLVEAITSLLLIVKRYFRYEDIMRFVRTELYVPSAKDDMETLEDYKQEVDEWREQIDVFENVMLAYGYEGSAWLRDEEWIYARIEFEDENQLKDYDVKMQETANQVKDTIRISILPFYKKIKEVETNHEALVLIYEFLIENGIKDQLLFWRDQALENEELEEARQHEQVWKTMVQLFDEFDELLGREPWNMDDFLTIVDTGFTNATYSIVPPRIDQVIVSNFDQSRVGKKKYVFYLGMDDVSLPMTRDQDSILSDEDRGQIADQLADNQFLTPVTKEKNASEPFSAYQAFMFASEKLIFSYSKKNDGSSDNKLSPYIKRIGQYFGIKPKAIQASINTDQEADSLDFIGKRKQTIGQLISIFRDNIDKGTTPSQFWLSIYKLVRDKANPDENRMFSSLSYKNIPHNLDEELAQELYGKDLYMSVSQLESYYLDPYSHFLRYGLKLQERKVLELTPAETGNFFHESLDLIIKQILKGEKPLEDLTKQEIDDLCASIFDEILSKNAFKILSSSNQMEFTKYQLINTVKQRLYALQKQLQYSKMKPKTTELLFGHIGSQRGVTGPEFNLNNGGKLYLRGKIDRVDELQVEGKDYLGIVDYKSSDKSFKFNEIYYGLMMQMLTYFQVALLNSDEIFDHNILPGVAMYSRIHNPKLKQKDLKNSDFQRELLKSFKYKGLILNDPNLLDSLDLSLPEEKLSYSSVYPYKKKKDGTFSSKSLITEEELRLLFEHNEYLIRKAGNEIIGGNLKLEPFYDKKHFTPSVGGEYRPISQFDPLLNENNYKDLPTMEKDQLIDVLKQKYKDGEDGH